MFTLCLFFFLRKRKRFTSRSHKIFFSPFGKKLNNNNEVPLPLPITNGNGNNEVPLPLPITNGNGNGN
jgi:hypothetical protein